MDLIMVNRRQALPTTIHQAHGTLAAPDRGPVASHGSTQVTALRSKGTKCGLRMTRRAAGG